MMKNLTLFPIWAVLTLLKEIEMFLEIKLISKILEAILTQILPWTVVPLKPEMN